MLDQCNTHRIKLTRSTAELNTVRHKVQFIVSHKRRPDSKTQKSCGLAPSPALGSRKQQPHSQSSLQAALLIAARSFAHSGNTRRLRRPGFISVSGQCAARSALFSDLRLKRISGVVAATEHLRAPMNGPNDPPDRAGFASIQFD